MELSRRYIAAAVQMDSGSDKGENLRRACAYVDEAAAHGAKLVCFPENMNLVGHNTGEGGGREPIPGYTTEKLMQKAAEHRVYIHSGSLFEKLPDDARAANTSVLIGPDGCLKAKYSKMHTFDGTLPDGTVTEESRTVRPGDRLVTAETALGTFGFSVCFDIRFPEMYRLMAERGAQVIFVPAVFARTTGKDHWEPLLRARAIENFCYIIAPDQTGRKKQYQAHGHSMIIDPWGKVLAQAGEEEGVIYAPIDLDYADEVRGRLPTLPDRCAAIYEAARREMRGEET